MLRRSLRLGWNGEDEALPSPVISEQALFLGWQPPTDVMFQFEGCYPLAVFAPLQEQRVLFIFLPTG